jgi:hypothetical protein
VSKKIIAKLKVKDRQGTKASGEVMMRRRSWCE